MCSRTVRRVKSRSVRPAGSHGDGFHTIGAMTGLTGPHGWSICLACRAV